MVVSSGNYDIIETGNAITFDENSNIVIRIKTENGFQFEIELDFEENGEEREILSKVDEENKIIQYKCLNFGVGAGTAEPIMIGHTSGKEMYLHFWVEKISANKFIRNVQYTVFKER